MVTKLWRDKVPLECSETKQGFEPLVSVLTSGYQVLAIVLNTHKY